MAYTQETHKGGNAMDRIFNITVTDGADLPYPLNQEVEQMGRIIIGPYEWEHRLVRAVQFSEDQDEYAGTWYCIRNPADDEYSHVDAHTRSMLDALLEAHIQGMQDAEAADAAMGDPYP